MLVPMLPQTLRSSRSIHNNLLNSVRNTNLCSKTHHLCTRQVKLKSHTLVKHDMRNVIRPRELVTLESEPVWLLLLSRHRLSSHEVEIPVCLCVCVLVFVMNTIYTNRRLNDFTFGWHLGFGLFLSCLSEEVWNTATESWCLTLTL